MVTLLSPKQNNPGTGYAEPESAQTALLDYRETSQVRVNEELAAPQPSTGAESTSGISKKNFWASLASPLVDLRELLAGPPLTERERRRQALTEARTRNAASLNWFYRTPF